MKTTAIRFLTTILLLTISLNLTSCRWFTDSSSPLFLGTKPQVPDGTPAFRKGWQHGCDNATYARSNQFYRHSLSGFNFDAKLISNPEYRFGLQRGYSVCFDYALSPVSGAQTPADRYISPYGNDPMGYTATGASWDTASGGLFGGLSDPVKGSMGDGLDNVFGAFTKSPIAGTTGENPGTIFGSNPIWSGGKVCAFGFWCN